jgi:hypothetical protein
MAISYEDLLEELVLQVLCEATWLTCTEIRHELWRSATNSGPTHYDVHGTLWRLHRLKAVERQVRSRRGFIKEVYWKMRD